MGVDWRVHGQMLRDLSSAFFMRELLLDIVYNPSPVRQPLSDWVKPHYASSLEATANVPVLSLTTWSHLKCLTDNSRISLLTCWLADMHTARVDITADSLTWTVAPAGPSNVVIAVCSPTVWGADVPFSKEMWARQLPFQEEHCQGPIKHCCALASLHSNTMHEIVKWKRSAL